MTPFDPRLPIIATQARVKTCHVFHLFHAMREAGKGFHAQAFALFAGLEEKHVTAIVEALAAHDALPEKRSKITARAHRLPDDWTPPDDYIEWASDARRWQPDDARQEAEIFANYWQAKSGKDACKLDWRKTWQNWVRNSRRPDGDYRLSVPIVSNAEHMERTAALYEKMGRATEAAEIRARLASNVLPFKATG
jgi:hypothetical protein